MVFSKIKADNICLNDERHLASWHADQSGGCCFVTPSLHHGNGVMVRISGSGRVLLGITSNDPDRIERFPISVEHIRDFVLLNEVKLHKRFCIITIFLNDCRDRVTSRFGDTDFTLMVRPDRKYYVALDVKFGDLEISLISPERGMGYQFSNLHGNNIRIPKEPSCVKTVRKSPASLCFSAEPLESGVRLFLHARPMNIGNQAPGRFYVCFRLIFTHPANFRRHHPHLLDMSVPGGELPAWTHLATFEKNHCDGEMSVELHRDRVCSTSALGQESSTVLHNWRSEKDVWLAVELYGVNVRIRKQIATQSRPNEETAALCGARSTASRDGPNLSNLSCPLQPVYLMTKDDETRELLNSSQSSFQESYISEKQGVPVRQIQQQEQTPLANTIVGMQPNEPRGAPNLKDNIRRNFGQLLDSLQPVDLCDQLYQHGVIPLAQHESLKNKAGVSTREANRDLLTILSRQPIARATLNQALQGSHQAFLAPYFFPE